VKSKVSSTDATYFRSRLSRWHVGRRRLFPWRDTDAPFEVLLAEVLLRRTQAKQVAVVFAPFLRRFPTPNALAAARPSRLRSVLGSLGLEWRTRALPRLARQLVRNHGGEVPADVQSLQSLDGVGPYVAAAVVVTAYGRRESPVDTNTARVAVRYFGLEIAGEARRSGQVASAVRELVSARSPRRSFEALMDFAAGVCRARNPRCAECPVRARCVLYRSAARYAAGVE
jgi:A/G-specific adenine glycosylase